MQMCTTWAEDEAKRKRELEERKKKREKDLAEMAKRPTTALEFRSGRTVQINLKGNDFEIRPRVGATQGSLAGQGGAGGRPTRDLVPD